MSTLVSKATGNLTTNTTWAAASAVANAQVDDETGTLAISNSNIDSTAFTLAATAVDRVGIKLSALVGATGTVTISLRNSTSPGSRDFSVTVNMSDLPASGWFFVKAGSSVTPNGTDSYVVRLVRSTASGTMTVYASASTAATINRLVCFTTDNTPASGDKLIVAAEYTAAATSSSFTVTMNETAATSYGPTWSSDTATPGGIQVCKGGTLTWGTAGSTNYYLKWKGRFVIYDQGTVNVGTSGTRIPSSSSALLEMDSAANVDTGLVVLPGGTLNAYGNNSRTRKAKLTADASASATSLTLDTTSGWLVAGSSPWGVGDDIAIASTTRTPGQTEKRTISTVPGGTSATITSGLTNAHSGTSPTQAEVINLTGNVRIRGVSSSLQGYLSFGTTSVVTIDNAEILQCGSNTTGKRGIDIETTTGSCSITNCSIHDSTVSSSRGFNLTSSSGNNITLQNNVTYNLFDSHIYTVGTTGASITIDGNWCLLCTSPGSSSFAHVLYFQDIGMTVTNNVAVSGYGGIRIAERNNASAVGTWSGNSSHSHATMGIETFISTTVPFTLTNLTAWRNSSAGIYMGSNTEMGVGIVFESPILFGNAGSNIAVEYSQNFIINNGVLNGDSTFSTTSGISIQNDTAGVKIRLNSCDFGTVSGIKTAHTNDIALVSAGAFAEITLSNTKLASGTEISGQTFLVTGSFVSSQKHDQTAGSHKTWATTGTVSTDSTIYNTASPSQRLTPNNATYKLDSAALGSGRGFLYPVANGATVTPSAYVRKSSSGDGAAYNGNQPRLILKRNDALGVTSDTVLDTMTVSTGTWEQLTGTTPAATDDGVFEIVVDCDGTTGWVNVDDVGGS